MAAEDETLKSIEVEGGSVDEAIKSALNDLNVSRDDVTVKVLCEEKRGLFGMGGGKPAKVKVTLKACTED